MASSTIPAGGASGGLQPKYQKFTSSGTFTLPDGYGAAKPLLVNIQVIGGGGGGSWTNANGGSLYYKNNNYYGWGAYAAWSTFLAIDQSSWAGGSGGLCATQLYLTSNLTVTVGAGGTRAVANIGAPVISQGNDAQGYTFTNGTQTGGTGGTTTASVLQATGGSGGVTSDMYAPNNYWVINGGFGSGGTPAGTTGAATPLLGTLAGGSRNTTPIRGSYGVGGINTDLTTSTGAEGTGGGGASVGATGAVILTWWQ
jgi:hypothetical protein